MLEHLVDAVGDPLDMLLDVHHHIGRHRRTARPGDGKEVGNAGDIEHQVIERSGGPLFAQGHPLAPLDVDLEQSAGHGIETGGEDDDVEIIVRLGSADHPGGDRFNGDCTDIDQQQIGSIEGLEETVINDAAFTAKSVGGA